MMDCNDDVNEYFCSTLMDFKRSPHYGMSGVHFVFNQYLISFVLLWHGQVAT